MDGFADAVIDWFETHGRHDLPWQADPSPYRVWVSEIMLQQTRVSTVIPYYQRFMARFPDVSALAAAEIDQVLHLWTGLGYYARARNLHKAARTIAYEHQGEFPDNLEELMQLSGIGRSTAGAILALSHGLPAPILDGNVKRVLARCFAVAGYPGNGRTSAELWALAERLLPPRTDDSGTGSTRTRIAAYTQGMMDLGATVCSRANPNCPRCPLQGRCLARLRNEVDRYPARKPSRALPLRSVAMFVFQDRDGRVLLEKRPPNGIWGSLYSLPQIDMPSPAQSPSDNLVWATHASPVQKSAVPPVAAAERLGATHASPVQKSAVPPLPTAERLGATHASPAPDNPATHSLELPSGLPKLRFNGEPPEKLEPIRHGFTHFNLHISPVRYRVQKSDSSLADSDRWLWYSIGEPVEVGLAAPVRKLLAQLGQASTTAR